MNQSEREKKLWEQQSEAWYAAIGRFVVKFEYLCHQMSTCIVFVLHSDGLRTQNLAQALLADVTAHPLLQSFRAVVAEVRKNEADDMRILDNVSKRVETLIKQRNDVIHRTWWVGGAASKDEDLKIHSIKFKKTKGGPEFSPRVGTVSDFNNLSSEADELSKIIFIMDGCLGLNEPFSKLFKVDGDGTVRLSEKG